MPCRNIKIPQRIKGDIGHLVPACTDLPPNPFLMGTSLTLLMACGSTSFQFYSMFLVQCTWLMAEKLWSDPALGHSNVTAVGQPWE